MKKDESKQKLAVMRNIIDHAHKMAWECIECGCSNIAINSHLLQRHGILDNITENDHSYDEDGSTALGVQKSINGDVWDNCFIHILPLENSTEIIVGYSNNHTNQYPVEYINSWEGLDNNALGLKLTDLFAGHIESWGLAPSLYRKLKVDNKLKYCNYMRDYY